MKPKYVAVMVILSAFVGGIAGALVSYPRVPELAQFEEIKVKKLTADFINADTITTQDKKNQRCSISGGSILATNSVKTGVLKGEGLEVYQAARLKSLKTDSIFSRKFMAAKNPLAQKTEDIKIYAEMAGDLKSGGGLVIRSKAGGVPPGKPVAAAGYQLVAAYDQGGYPVIFAEDNAAGKATRNYVLRFARKDGEVKAKK